MMKGFHHPKGSQRRFCAGSPICTTSYPTNGARGVPANVEWKSKEEQSQRDWFLQPANPHVGGLSMSGDTLYH